MYLGIFHKAIISYDYKKFKNLMSVYYTGPRGI